MPRFILALITKIAKFQEKLVFMKYPFIYKDCFSILRYKIIHPFTILISQTIDSKDNKSIISTVQIFDRFNNWLLKIFVKKETRENIGYLEAWVSIIGNIILFIFKFVAGIFLNSLSLIADAWHSLSDLAPS